MTSQEFFAEMFSHPFFYSSTFDFLLTLFTGLIALKFFKRMKNQKNPTSSLHRTKMSLIVYLLLPFLIVKYFVMSIWEIGKLFWNFIT